MSTSEGTVYVVHGQDAVFVVKQHSTTTSLVLTVDLRAKSCSFNRLIKFPNGFLIECQTDNNTDTVRLIRVKHSGSEWGVALHDVDMLDSGKAVNPGVSAVLEANDKKLWYFFAREDLLCSYDLENGPVPPCYQVAQDKCRYIAEILPVSDPEHPSILVACTDREGDQRKTHVALYSTRSATVTKRNYPTGDFRAIHVSGSGEFTAFVGANFITVAHTLDSSSSAQVVEHSVPGELVFSLVIGETLVYTTKEAALKGLVTYKTYALDLAKEGASAELLEGDNCTVTQQPAPGEWIVACSNALFWYRGNVSDRVRIPWLDGTAKEQQCFSGHPRVGPVTEPPASTSPTLQPDDACPVRAPCDVEQWKTLSTVMLSGLVVALFVIVALIGIIVILCCKLHGPREK